MNEHRIRMTELEGDPIPVLWIEIKPDSWLDVSINLTANDDLHILLHEFIEEINVGSSRPLTWHTRAFNLFEGLTGYQEAIIE